MSSAVLAAPSGDARDHASGFVTFRLADNWFGIGVDLVQEVLQPQSTTRVPLSSSRFAGLLNLRGVIVSCIDLRGLLGLDPRPHDVAGRFVVIQHDGELFALITDDVGDVEMAAGAPVTDGMHAIAAEWRRACSRVVVRDHDLLLLVSVTDLLQLAMDAS